MQAEHSSGWWQFIQQYLFENGWFVAVGTAITDRPHRFYMQN
jgi:hypothetical protein